MGAVAPRSLRPSAIASRPGRSSGGTFVRTRVHFSSSSPAAASFTAAFNARTVSKRARATHAASASPRATGSTASACRTLTSPARTAARSNGRTRSSRARCATFCAVLAAIPSTSRA